MASDADGGAAHRDGGMNLRAAVLEWATPTVTGNNNRKGASPTSGDGLRTMVQAEWPTPQANDATRTDCPSEQRRNTPSLGAAVRMHPTPQAADAKKFGETPEGWSRRAAASKARGVHKQESLAVTVHEGRKPAGPVCPLNPAWVGALMGFPPGWTDTAGPPAGARRRTRGSRRASSPESTSGGSS